MSLVQAIMTEGDSPVVDIEATYKARGSEHIVTLPSSANERLVALAMQEVFPSASWGDGAAGEVTIPLFQLGIMALYGATTSHDMLHMLDACVPTPRKCVDILSCLINLGIDRKSASSVAAWELRVHSLLESRGARLPVDLTVAKDEWLINQPLASTDETVEWLTCMQVSELKCTESDDLGLLSPLANINLLTGAHFLGADRSKDSVFISSVVGIRNSLSKATDGRIITQRVSNPKGLELPIWVSCPDRQKRFYSPGGQHFWSALPF